MNKMTIRLSANLKIPLYEQIYEHIKSEIQEGILSHSEKLPSARALAEHLEVSRSTVDLAYEQLRAEGYVEAVPCKGFYVAQIKDLYQFQKDTDFEIKKEMLKKSSYKYDFTPYGVDLKSFPYEVWRKLSKDVLRENKTELVRLGNPMGEYDIRKAIMSYLHQARGVSCTPEQIVIGAGSDYMLLLIHILFGNQKKIAFENPTYLKAYNVFDKLGYELYTVDADENGMEVANLDKTNVDLVYVMPSHQYPLGTIMPLKRRLELLEWSQKKERRYIIEDDYDSEFRYKGKPIPALQGYDTYGNVIYLGTFSKAIAPAIRISYMVLPVPLLEVFRERGVVLSSSVSKIDQMIICKFIEERYFERHLNRTRALYKSRHDTLIQCLKPLLSICNISGEHGGVHLLLTFHNGKTEEELIESAEREGIKVYGLSEYCVEKLKQKRTTILLGYANMREEAIKAACEKLISIWM